MAQPGNWIAGDPGHVDEHNRIYEDLASKVELANAMQDLVYQAPVVLSAEPPIDQGAIWIDQNPATSFLPLDGEVGDILAIMDLSQDPKGLEWLPNETFSKTSWFSVGCVGGFLVSGNSTEGLAEDVPVAEFAPSVYTRLALPVVTFPDNWEQYSVQLIWTNTNPEPIEPVMVLWRLESKPITPLNPIATEYTGTTANLEPGATNVVLEGQLYGAQAVPASKMVCFHLIRVGNEDSFNQSAAAIQLTFHKEA